MPVALRAFTSDHTGSSQTATPPAVTAPAGMAAGDFVVLVITCRDNTTTWTTGPGAYGFTLRRTVTDGSGQMEVWAALGSALTGTSWALTRSAAGKFAWSCAALTGVDTSSPWHAEDGAGESASNATAHSTPTLATSASAYLLAVAGDRITASTWTWPGGWTERTDLATTGTNSVSNSLATYDSNPAGAGSYAVTATASTASSNAYAWIGALTPAASGGGNTGALAGTVTSPTGSFAGTVTGGTPDASTVTQLAPTSEGSSSPTYRTSQHHLARTAGGRLLVAHGWHGTGVQLRWSDNDGATWSKVTRGDVTAGEMLTGQGTGDRPATVTVAGSVAYVVMAPNSSDAAVTFRRLSDLDNAAGPQVGALQTLSAAGRLPDAAPITGGVVLTWFDTTANRAATITDLTSDAPSTSSADIFATGTTGRYGTLIPHAGALAWAGRGASGLLRLYLRNSSTGAWTEAAAAGSTTVSNTTNGARAGDRWHVAYDSNTGAGTEAIAVQSWSADGSSNSLDLALTGYADPTLATDGTTVILLCRRTSDGAIVSREWTAAGGWSGSDLLEMSPRGGAHTHPNAMRDLTGGKLRWIVRAPGDSTAQSEVLYGSRAAVAVVNTGSLAGTVASPVGGLSGSVVSAGALVGVTAAAVATLAAGVLSAGTLAGTAPTVTGSLTAATTITGAVAGTTEAAVGAFAGTSSAGGTIAGTTAAAVGSFTAAVRITGTLAATAPAAVADLAATSWPQTAAYLLARAGKVTPAGTFTTRYEVTSPPNDTTYDFRGARFEGYFDHDAVYEVGAFSGGSTEHQKNTRGWELGESSSTTGLAVIGGVIEGDQPETLTWGRMKYGQATQDRWDTWVAGGRSGSAPGDDGTNQDGDPRFHLDPGGTAILDGLRVRNTHDGIGMYGISGTDGAGRVLIRNTWLQDIHDDAIENDEWQTLTVSDCLIERAYGFLSTRTARSALEDGPGSVNVQTVEDTIIRLHRFPGGHEMGSSETSHDKIWKALDNSPPLVMRRVVIAVEMQKTGSSLTLPTRAGDTYEDVTIVWLGGGAYPGNVPPGVTVVTTESTYTTAAQRWKTRHGVTDFDTVDMARMLAPTAGDGLAGTVAPAAGSFAGTVRIVGALAGTAPAAVGSISGAAAPIPFEPWMRWSGGLLLVDDFASGLLAPSVRETELVVADLAAPGLAAVGAPAHGLAEVAQPTTGLTTTDLASPGIDVLALATTALQFAPEE